MRFKAIPQEAVAVVEKYPLATILGAGALALGGYYYYTHRSPSENMGADPNASTQAGFSYGMPQVYGSDPTTFGGGGSAGAGGVVDAITNPAGQTGGSQYDWALLDLEKSKASNEFSLASKTLDAQLKIAAANASIAMQGIQSANWQTSAQLAQSFLMSGSQYFAGNVGGQTFAFIGSGNPSDVYSGKNQSQVLAQQQSNYNTFLSQFGGLINGTQPSVGSVSTGSYAGAQPSSANYTGGSTGNSPATSGYSYSSTQSAVQNAVAPSGTQLVSASYASRSGFGNVALA